MIIGGQDAKAIQLDAKGNIQKFVMNDKCAAGTGRFLDVMARVLEIPLKEMGEAHFKADKWASVSSTCTVFAESEVISQLSKGLSKENIIAGVHQSIASKACSLVYRVGVNDAVVMCGGVARMPVLWMPSKGVTAKDYSGAKSSDYGSLRGVSSGI